MRVWTNAEDGIEFFGFVVVCDERKQIMMFGCLLPIPGYSNQVNQFAAKFN